MPKDVRDRGGISEAYFAGMPRGTMKNWGDPGKAISDFFHPKAKAQKPQAMNRKQVSASASSMGYDVTPDGRFVKKGSGDMKKSKKKKGTLFGKPRGEVVKHPGSFKAAAKKAGKSTAEEAKSVLKPGSKASPKMKKKAGLAKAFATMRRKKKAKA